MSASTTREMAQERERFLSGIAPRRIRQEILHSWQRCSSWLVQPERIGPRYQPNIDTDAPLLRAANPVLDSLTEQLGQLRVGFVLTDAEARILDRRVGEKELSSALDALDVTPGFVYTEDTVGTNGLGTTIELNRTSRIDGHEHYADQLVGFTCVGVPIVDPLSRRRVGVLDVTCPADPENMTVAKIAERTARHIEQQLFEQQSQQERALLAEFMAASRRQHAGVVVVSDRMMLTNPQAARLLDGVDQPLIWEQLGSIVALASGTVEDELTLPGGRTAHTRSVTLRHEQQVIGALMEIRPPIVRRNASSQVATRPAGPSGLAGSDRAFLDAYQAGRKAGATQVLVIRGEPGSGKLAMAQALHHDRDETVPIVQDAAAIELEGEAAWLDRTRALLSGQPTGFVLRHLDLLPAPALRIISSVLQAAMEHGWRCHATLTCSSVSERDALPGLDVAQVWVPPLRNRVGDIPALVAHFARPLRVAPDAVQLLMRLSWPGNVRELRAVTERMCDSAAPAAHPGLADVPLEVRRAAPRRTLTRFERAEIHAILEALAETCGNKKDAADLLGIARSTLYRKLQAAGVDLDNTVF
jgi:transcriptional regulator of acetoin/glycerol metabolism